MSTDNEDLSTDHWDETIEDVSAPAVRRDVLHSDDQKHRFK